MDALTPIDFLKYFKVKLTQIQMVTDRKYTQIPDYESRWLLLPFDDALHEFIETATSMGNRNIENFLQQEYNDKSGHIVKVVYIPVIKPSKSKPGKGTIGADSLKTLSKTFINEIIETQKRGRISHTIIITPIKPTANFMQRLSKAVIPSLHPIEYFLFEELSYVVTKHILVPKHYLLDRSDYKTHFEDLSIISKLPGIHVDDPIVRYYGASIGDIFLIIRNDVLFNRSLGKYIFYRRVTNVQKID